MNLRKKSPPSSKTGHSSSEALEHRGLLARWFILYRLVEEVERAARYERPISVMVARPSLLAGERLTREALEAAVAAASKTARSTDLVGWMSDDSILIVMPETGEHDATVAAHRWQNEMWLHARARGGRKWEVILLDDLQDFATVERFHGSVAARAANGQAA